MKFSVLPAAIALTLSITACQGNQTPQADTPPANSSPAAQTAAQTAAPAKPSITKNWQTYTSTQGKYTAQFPGKPEEQTRTLNTEVGETALVLVGYEDATNRRAFAISHNTFNVPAGTSFNAEKGLDGTRDGIAKGIGATITKETKITQNGLSGREITLQKDDDFAAKARIFYNKGILYQLLVIAEDKKLEAPEVNAFLDAVAFSQ